MASIDCHERIAAAINGRNPRQAEAAMAQHFDDSVRALLAAGVI
jgi:GntR family transcriptional regulator, transcriptional repressor for pyruvate dehydrogenase complex